MCLESDAKDGGTIPAANPSECRSLESFRSPTE